MNLNVVRESTETDREGREEGARLTGKGARDQRQSSVKEEGGTAAAVEGGVAMVVVRLGTTGPRIVIQPARRPR